MLSFCIHQVNMDNRSPAPLTTRGSPNHIARHQRGHHYKSLRNTTKAREASPARRNAKPRSRSCPARSETITLDCPGHPGRHRATSLHAAAQTLPKAVAQTHTLPAAPHLPIRRRRIVLPRGRPANHRCKLVCWFGSVRRRRAVRRSLGYYHAAHLCPLEAASEANAAAELAVDDRAVGAPLRSCPTASARRTELLARRLHAGQPHGRRCDGLKWPCWRHEFRFKQDISTLGRSLRPYDRRLVDRRPKLS